MFTRNKDRIDYKIFHETGRKVVISGGKISKNKMATDEKIVEMKIVADIKYTLGVYTLEDLISGDDIEEGLTVISGLGQQFRHIHVELKNKLGNDYETQYPEYNKTLEDLAEFRKSAKTKLRINRQDKEKEALKIEEEFLYLKIKQLQNTVDVTIAKNISEIDDYIIKIEGFIDEYFGLCGKLKCCLGEKYNELYDPKFKQLTLEMREDVKMGKILKQKLLEAEEKSKRQVREEFEQSVHITGAENLSREIDLRCSSLQIKYDNNFENLSDYQVLGISQNKNLDSEFNELLGKVTSLAALAPVGGEPVQKLLGDAIRGRDELAKKRDKFVKDLQQTVIERDITPDKMKNASGLKIELPKFSGYECKMDFYTFRSQFKKLIEPAVQKKYWADYLKRNYLCGSALILVEKETDYSKIWQRLLEPFGNARLLLQNKLSALDKVGGLWKIKGDEKIGNAIAGLINAMSDLSTLAAEHGIEGQLYEGGSLEKILTLIGEKRHRKFISQNLRPSGSKRDEWEKLLQFLKQELQVRERLCVNNKTVQLMGLNLNKNEVQKGSIKSDASKRWPEANHVATNEDLMCHICDKGDHTHVTTARGNKIIPYYV